MALSALFATGLARAISQRRNVMDYGAVGDGTTDDGAAFSAAQAGTDYIELYAPPAVYVVRLALRSNMRIWAPGATFKLQVSAGEGDIDACVIKIGESALVQNVSIIGPTIDGVRDVGGPYPASPDAARIGINIGWAYNITLRDVTVTDCYTDGILIGYLHDGSSNITLDSVTCNNNWRHGLTISSGSGIKAASGCAFTNNGGYHPALPGYFGNGIDIEDEFACASGVDGVSIAGCSFSGNVGGDVGISSFWAWPKSNIAVSGCTCASETPDYSIGVYLSSLTTFSNIAVTGNTCAKALSCTGTSGGTFSDLAVTGNTATSIVVGDSLASTTFERTSIAENDCAAIRIDGTVAEEWMNVDDNTVAAPAEPTAHTDIAIRIMNIPEAVADGVVQVRRNVATGGCYGISVDSPAAALIEDNDVSAQRNVGTLGAQGIVASGAAHIIDGNTVDDAEGRGIYSTGDGAQIENNEVTNCAQVVGSSAGIYVEGDNCEVAYNTATGNTGPLSLGDIYDGGSGNNVHDNTVTP